LSSLYKIFIGYDSREDIAYQVCRQSIIDTCKRPHELEIIPLKLNELTEQGIYRRPDDTLGSTEFTFSRFLVPHLCDFTGWALFIDCDFLFLEDVTRLFKEIDDRYALMCAKHDYTPKNKIKMDGKKQVNYPRKNWSSCVLWNCGHASNKKLTKELVNDKTTTGVYLHRFQWLPDSEIGTISHEWNWLINWYHEPKDGKPKALHYTEGGPWFKDYQKCEYAADWYIVEKEYNKSLIKLKQPKVGPFDNLEPNKEKTFHALLRYWTDPNGRYFNETLESVNEKIRNAMGNKVVAIDSEGGINYASKGFDYDNILFSFVIGAQGIVSNWDNEKDTGVPLVIRGLGGGSRKAIQECWKTNRTFYAVDTGYFGNWKTKYIHRVTKNALQNIGPIIERPLDRAKSFGYKFKKFTKGSKILVCPPSEKVMETFNQPDPATWVKEIKKELRKYTTRPVEVRLKPNRTERITTKTIQAALQEDVHCLITYNSIAAVEALMEGKPAIVLGPNAAQSIAETNLANVDNPKYPDRDTMDAFMAHLAYCQFTLPEMTSGFAWNIINESS